MRGKRVASLGASLLAGAAVFAVSILAAHAVAADKAPPREDPGKKLVEEICSFCHGLEKLQGQAFTRDEWNNVIKGMVDEGAPVTKEEFSLILDYLAKNFGPAPEQGTEEQR